jgi:peroxiredoxin
MRWWIGCIFAVAAFGFWAHSHTYAGKTAPDFSLTTSNGYRLKLSDQRGKVVVLDFWATWCGPCRASLPHLQDLCDNPYLEDRGLIVWAVNDQEPSEQVSYFMENNRYTFTALLDPGGTAISAYGVSGIPMTVIVGRDGVVKKVFVGYGPGSAAEEDDAVEKALAEAGN